MQMRDAPLARNHSSCSPARKHYIHHEARPAFRGEKPVEHRWTKTALAPIDVNRKNFVLPGSDSCATTVVSIDLALSPRVTLAIDCDVRNRIPCRVTHEKTNLPLGSSSAEGDAHPGFEEDGAHTKPPEYEHAKAPNQKP